MIVDPNQHPDFIWTWKRNACNAKVSHWIPYFSAVEKVPRTNIWTIAYNGGELNADLKKANFAKLYDPLRGFLVKLRVNWVLFPIA